LLGESANLKTKSDPFPQNPLIWLMSFEKCVIARPDPVVLSITNKKICVFIKKGVLLKD